MRVHLIANYSVIGLLVIRIVWAFVGRRDSLRAANADSDPLRRQHGLARRAAAAYSRRP